MSNSNRISLEVEKVVIRGLTRFSENFRFGRSTSELKGLVQEWSQRLGRFKPSQVETAFSLAYDELERFPSFAQIRKRIPTEAAWGGGYPVECPHCKRMNPLTNTFKGFFCNQQCEQDFEPERLAGMEIWRKFKRDRPDLFNFTNAIERAKKLPVKPPVNP